MISLPDVLGPLALATTAAQSQQALIQSLQAQLRVATCPTGITRYFQLTSPAWDAYLNTTDPALQATINAECQRMCVYSPFFDTKLAWYPNALVYFDSYAIYNPSALATAHPEWILKDAAGNKLFIPWGCSGGTCPQYAGDVGNPAFVAYQIAQMKLALAPGYKGLFIDDVNLSLSIGNGSGQLVRPIDPRTKVAMTDVAWRQYFAQYMEAVRVAFPANEILHNSVWYAGEAFPAGDTWLRRQHVAADYINIERGIGGDTGITGGTGPLSLSSLLQYIDFVHSLGRVIVSQDYLSDNLLYSLACYYLIQSGRDFQCFGNLDPTKWPAELLLDLGQATGARSSLGRGIWTRAFVNGLVYVGEPGAAAQIITLPSAMVDETGQPVSSIQLGANTGRLLRFH